MAVIKVSNGGGTVALEKYLKQEQKTEQKLITGKDCNANKFAKSFNMTREIYNKKGGRQHYHIIQSFKPGEVEPGKAHKVGVDFINIEKLQGFQAVIITHKDKAHIHNHIIINSVSQKTGKKFRLDKACLREMKEKSNELCKEQNLSTIDFSTKNVNNKNLSIAQIKTREKGKNKQNRQIDLIAIISSKKKFVKSKEEFVKELAKYKFEVKWSNRKRLTYIDLMLKSKNDKLIEKGKKGIKYKFGERSLSKYYNNISIDKKGIEKAIENNIKKHVQQSQTRAFEEIEKLEFKNIKKGNWVEKVVTLKNEETNKELYMYLSNCEKKLVYMSEKKNVLNDFLKRKKPNHLTALRDEAKKGFFPVSGITFYNLNDEELEKAKTIDYSDNFELDTKNKTLSEKKLYTKEKQEHFRRLGLKEIKKEQQLENEQNLYLER